MAAVAFVLSAQMAGAQEVDNLNNEDAQFNAYLRRLQQADTGTSQADQTDGYGTAGLIGTDAPGTEEPNADGQDIQDATDPLSTASTSKAGGSKTESLTSPVTYARNEPVKRIEPVQSHTVTADDAPFDAPGIRMGSFVLRPTLELGITASRAVTTSESGTPPTPTTNASTSFPADAALRLQLDSDWSRHSLSVNAYGRLEKTLEGAAQPKPEASVNATGRLDITDRTTLTGTFDYAYGLDSPQSAAFFAATDPSLSPAVTGTNEPATQEIGAALTLRQETNSIFGEAELSAARTLYGDANLSDGSTVHQRDLDNTVYDGRLRAGLSLSPVLKPFVEASYGIRRMANTPDSGGLDRNSKRYAVRAGSEFDFGEKLNGELSAGYIRESVEDPALASIGGVAVDATVNWSPQRGTNLGLDLSTTTEIGTRAGESGSVLYSAGLNLTHQLRANLTSESSVGIDYRNTSGAADETTLSAETGLTYWFNRYAGLRTRLRHEQTTSPDPLNRERTTSAFVGLKLQR